MTCCSDASENQHSTYLRWTEQDVLFKQPQNSSPRRKRDVCKKRVMTSESLKCQLTSCEKNQNTECQCEYNKGMRPGWPVLWKLWHIETTPFKKLMTNLRKWKKLTHVPCFPTSPVKPKSYGDKTQMSFVREACVAFFRTWSLNFQIADTCTHCVPIFSVVKLTNRIVQNVYRFLIDLPQ